MGLEIQAVLQGTEARVIWGGFWSYMAYSFEVTGLSEISEIWVIGSLIVFGSTIVHGFTGYSFAKLYYRWETGNSG